MTIVMKTVMKDSDEDGYEDSYEEINYSRDIIRKKLEEDGVATWYCKKDLLEYAIETNKIFY